MNAPISIYIHVPFCAAKCAYCDFASFPNRLRDADAYFDALNAEIESWSDTLKNCEIQTVFFGGGTPTIVNPECIVRTLSTLFAHSNVNNNAEITIEGNPGTLNAEKLRAYRRAGINRLSLGAQSMNDETLRFIGRIHTAKQVAEAVSMARDIGFANLNLDLIYALPGQTLDDWRRTLEAAITLKPEHISAYSLIVEEGTEMFRRVACGECAVPNEDDCINMQRAATQTLAQAGYARYEISNYAKAGFECKHNIAYWRRYEYLGFGCAAHSMFGGRRFANPSDLSAYLAGERRVQEENLTLQDAIEETLMLGTRMCEGVSLEKWAREFGFRLERKPAVQKLEAAGIVRVSNDRLSLTERGMEVQDAVVIALLE